MQTLKAENFTHFSVCEFLCMFVCACVCIKTEKIIKEIVLLQTRGYALTSLKGHFRWGKGGEGRRTLLIFNFSFKIKK